MALHDLQQQYGIRFKKGLGQNLLLDENINRILTEAAALDPGDDVVEVGAGLGALTGHLGTGAGRVLAIEIDRSFIPCLEEQFAAIENITIFCGDILNHSVEKLLVDFLPGGTTYKMVSNLPYYITTPILFHFWESTVVFERMVVMVQEEVGQRMVAPVGASNYGFLTLAAQCYADVDVVHKVGRGCFRPQPKVDSCIVRFRSRPQPPASDAPRPFLLGVVRAAFSQRRKTLRNTLAKSNNFGVSASVVLDALEAASIDPGRRAQTLSLDDFVLLANEIHARLDV